MADVAGLPGSPERDPPVADRGSDLAGRLVLPLESELAGRLAWFIHLRWYAALLLMFAGFWTFRYRIGVPGLMLVAIGTTVGLYNLALHVLLPYARNRYLNANLQIILDWMALAAVMHYTGGLHSPALTFFFFHVLIAAILLPGYGSYWHALAATVIVVGVGALEATGAIPHVRPVWAPLGPPDGIRFLVLIGSFALVTLLSSFLVSTIADHLRQTEAEQVALERELAEAIRRLEEANRELIAHDEGKSRYTRTVTHQLRSPLAAIQSLLRVALDGYTGALGEKTRDVVSRAEIRTLKLLDTVGDLLNLAALDFRPTADETRVIGLAPTVVAVLARHEPTASARHIALVADVPEELTLHAAPEDIERALDNLVGNAIRYSFPDGTVRVSACRIGDEVRIAVADEGIGIPEDARTELFREFFRAPNARLHDPIGTGLGLVIVKRSVERWGGGVSLVSEIERGSTFTLHFPQAKEQCEPPAAGDPSDPSEASA